MYAIENIVSVSRSESPVLSRPADLDYLRAGGNVSLMGTALTTIEKIMLLFTELANAKFEEMGNKTEVSRDAQDMANRVDALLAGLADAQSQAELPADVIAYMHENKIEVNGMSIDQFLAENGPELNKADLTSVKSTLESFSGRASDFVQQNQLKLQQLMQNFNTAVTMANSIQSMTAESTKSIAQAIR